MSSQSEQPDPVLPEALSQALSDLSDGDRAGSEADPPGFEALESALEGSARSGLSERPTGQRVAAVFSAALAVLGAAWGWSVFSALDTNPTPRFWAALLAVTLWITLGLTVSLRPLYKPPLPSTARWAMLALLVLTPLALAVWPPDTAYTLHDPPGGLKMLLGPELACLLSGGLSALPVLAIWALFQRATSPLLWPAILAAGAAGLTGFVSLDFHCAITTRSHLLIGHFGAVMTVLGGSALLMLLLGRRRD